MDLLSYVIAGVLFAAFIAFVVYKMAQPKLPTGGANDDDFDIKDGPTRR